MRLRVLGCHGANTLNYRNVTLLVDGRVALDAGSLAATLSPDEQGQLETILVTHAHLDHVADLGAVSELRCQQEGPPIVIAAAAETIEALRKHFFNDVIWPDFTRIPSSEQPSVELRVLEPEQEVALGGGLSAVPVPVHHSIPSCGFLIKAEGTALAYSGDTGPTQRLWEVLNSTPELRAVITEVSFPNRLAELAQISGHLTPATMRDELNKLELRDGLELFLYGMKPLYVDEIQAELAEHAELELHVLADGEERRV